jgi:hypothetical protein
MAAQRVHVRADGGLTCGHPASPATTRPGPARGEVYCSLCALASIETLKQEIARTAAALQEERARTTAALQRELAAP